MIRETMRGITGSIRFTFRDAATGETRRRSEYHNDITAPCLAMIASRLAGEGNACDITYGAVGTGEFPGDPGNSATLAAELVRKPVSRISATGNEISVLVFFGAPEAVGTLTEFGLFGEDATLAADSGTMIDHAEITEVKNTGETMTVEITLTIS